MTDIVSFRIGELVETLSQKAGMLEGEIEEILDRIKIKSEINIVSFRIGELVETLSQKTGMLEGEIEEILDRIKIKSELKIKTEKIFTFEIKKNNEYNNPDIDVQINPHKEAIVATDLKSAMYEMYPNMRYKWHVSRPWDLHLRGLYIWAHWITYNKGYTRKTENYRIITCKLFDDIGLAYREFDDSDVEYMLGGYEPIFVLTGESGEEYGIYRTWDDAHDHIDDIKEKGFAIELKWVHP